MVPSLRTLLVGPEGSSFQRRLDVLSAIALGVLTFGAYALGVFRITGGVIMFPGDAAVVGLVAAALVGYQYGGLVFAWVTAYAPLLGFQADWAFFGLSGRSLSGKLAFFLNPEGLVVNVMFALAFGTLGFGAGALARRTGASLRAATERRRNGH